MHLLLSVSHVLLLCDGSLQSLFDWKNEVVTFHSLQFLSKWLDTRLVMISLYIRSSYRRPGMPNCHYSFSIIAACNPIGSQGLSFFYIYIIFTARQERWLQRLGHVLAIWCLNYWPQFLFFFFFFLQLLFLKSPILSGFLIDFKHPKWPPIKKLMKN